MTPNKAMKSDLPSLVTGFILACAERTAGYGRPLIAALGVMS